MAKTRYYTEEDVRQALHERVVGRTQASIAAQIGIKPQNLSAMLKGGAIHGKVLAWLGYQKVSYLYERDK